MGGSVSSGRTNDELVDNLVESLHIKTEINESVFRAVDRAIFYVPSHRDVAYRDLAWREGNIHISAPCIYAEVMEALKIEKGMSFLNIGSGTGYLSTMVGLILGTYGVNHGIEIHKDVVEYSKKCLSEFARTSPAFDEFNFCFPKFIHGNCLNIATGDDSVLYDRIYVGAGVTSDQGEFIKRLLKVNGILVMPLEDLLVQVIRKSDSEYVTKPIMSVLFANLISDDLALNSISMPKANPLSLQELCRYRIRELLRERISEQHPEFYNFNSKLKNEDELAVRCDVVSHAVSSTNTTNSDKNRDSNVSSESTSANSSQSSQFSKTNGSSANLSFFINRAPLFNNNNEHENSDDEETENEDRYLHHANESENVKETLNASSLSSIETMTSSINTENKRSSKNMQCENRVTNISSKNECTDFNNSVASTSDNEATSSTISYNEARSRITRSVLTTTAQRQHGSTTLSTAHHAPVKSMLASSRSDAMSLTVKELVERTIIKETNMCNTKPEAPPKRRNYLREKILQLCLPTTVKNYLLYNREI